MKKGFKVYLIIWLILFVLFQILVFAIPVPNKYSSSFWVAYVLITLILIGNLICAHLVFKADSAQKLFYNLPLLTISQSTLIITICFGIICLLVPGLPSWIGVVIGAILLAFYAVAIIKAKATGDLVGAIDQQVKEKTSFIRELTLQAEGLSAKANSIEAKVECKRVFEALRYSDPVSNPALTNVETNIAEKLQFFSEAVIAGDNEAIKSLSDELIGLIGDRNRTCKATKG